MKYVKTFEAKYESDEHGVSCAVLTNSELEQKKERMFNILRSEKIMSNLSDDQIIKSISKLIDIEIEEGLLKIEN